MIYIFFLSAFFICLVMTPLVRYVALKRSWMAFPVKERWHKKPTALMGGIAIFAGTALPLFFLAEFKDVFSVFGYTEGAPAKISVGTVVFMGSVLMFFLGLFDDFLRLKPSTKLVGQILVASFVVFMEYRLHWFISPTLDTLVTIVWIVGITNAFNLIDNMDGLCAGVGAVGSLYFVFLFAGRSPEAMGIALILAGSLTAFLLFNSHPASIFMGDSGSLVIGFILSVTSIHYSRHFGSSPVSSIAVPVMLLMVPILDTTMVTIIRLLSGRKASTGGRDHTSHRLVLIGMSEKGAVRFLYGVGAISGLSAIFVSRHDSFTSPVVIIPLVLSIVLMGIYLAQIRIYPEKEFCLLRERSYTPVLMELAYKRQVLLVILDFCLIAFAYYLSYRLRFDEKAFPYYFEIFLRSLPAVIACKFAAFFFSGIYRGFWRYLSSSDVFVYLKASFFASLLSVAAVTYLYRFEDFSKGIFLMDWLLTTGLLLGTRGSFRISSDAVKRKTLKGEKVLIYGAGRGGEILLREILNNKIYEINPAGFIDDDPLITGKNIQGYSILGGMKDLEHLVKKHEISGILVSFRNHGEDEGALCRFCRKHDLFLKRFRIVLEDVDLEDPRH